MNDQIQTYMSIVSAGFAARAFAVLGLMTVSNCGPVFGYDTRNPLNANILTSSLI